MKNELREVFIFESEDERDFVITKLQVRTDQAGDEFLKALEKETKETKLIAIHVFKNEKDRMVTVKLQTRTKNGTTTWKVYNPKARTKTEDQTIEDVVQTLNEL